MPSSPKAAPAPRPGGSALLVVDVQRGLFRKPIPVFRADELVANISALVADAHVRGQLIGFVQHSSPRHLQLGSDDWELHPGLCPTDADLRIHKTHGSAFDATPLQAELTARGIERLVVTGLVTHGCVRATVQAALALGYQVTLVADGHSSYRKDAQALLELWNGELQEAGALVVPTSRLLSPESVEPPQASPARGQVGVTAGPRGGDPSAAPHPWMSGESAPACGLGC